MQVKATNVTVTLNAQEARIIQLLWAYRDDSSPLGTIGRVADHLNLSHAEVDNVLNSFMNLSFPC